MNFLFKKIKDQKSRVADYSISFIRLTLVWLLSIFFLSLLEITINSLSKQFPSKIFQVIAFAFVSDFNFWISYLFSLYFFYLFISYISFSLANLLAKLGLLLFFGLQLALMVYFYTTSVPLGSDLFSYSLRDIFLIISASSGFSNSVIFIFLGLWVLLYITIQFLPKRVKVSPRMALLFPAVSIFFYFIPSKSTTFHLGSEYENNLTINKTAFFLSASVDYIFPSFDEIDIYADSYIGDYDGMDSNKSQTTYPFEYEYPFYHSNQAPDVLSPFFQPIKSQPNIVIILVEGLGRAFSNEEAYLGSFTPFLDSLANKSLYWKNMLSAGGRTFAVLPSLMSSMPFGKNGILEMAPNMPSHLSLYSILKRNGYQTSFFYGGNTEFDNMKSYLIKNHVDQIIEEKSFPDGYTKLPVTSQNFTWGYSDDQLYRLYFERKNKSVNKKPELNVILTVATHDPFLIKNQEKYINMAKLRIDKLSLGAEKKAENNNFLHQYSCIMYADESLKKFFQEYAKRSDYNQTIFIITGDHRMPEIPISTKIDRYHVPLLIYSPMLKRNAQFASVSTHFDIIPSVLSLLGKQTNIKLPKAGNSWMGDGLDTFRIFRNIHQFPLMQNKSTLIDFIMNEYHINGNSLFKITENMDESPISDEIKLKQLQAEFNRFKEKNAKVKPGFKLVPDSLISRYGIN